MTNATFLIGQKVIHLTCVTRNIHVKYQSPSTHYLKDISKVKVSDRMTERRNEKNCLYKV